MIGKMRIPLGVIAMIFESRPNVTIDAAILCLKAGDAVILRGGSEAIHSNLALAGLLHEALRSAGLPEDAAQVVETTDRAAVAALCKLDKYVDVMIPRGGESLVRAVCEAATMPVLKHYMGVCHLYIDEGADPVSYTHLDVYKRQVQTYESKKGPAERPVSSPLCAIGCINAKRKTEQSALLIHKKGIRRIRGAFALMAHASERGKGALAPLYRKHASGPFQQTAKTAATRRGFRARARRP